MRRWTLGRLVAAAVITFSVMLLLAVLQQRGSRLLGKLTDQEIEALIDEAKNDNVQRLQQIERVCRKYKLGIYKNRDQPSIFKHPPTPQYSVFYIDVIDRLSWCPIYKAASSSWLYNLCLLGGYKEAFLKDTKEQLSTLARRVYPELDYPQAAEALQITTKLLVVRHPFERLLSAYRDKLENTAVGGEHGTAHFYRRYGASIVAKYRAGGNKTRTEELLQSGTFYRNSGQPSPIGVEPTFKEFIRYILDTDLLNYADDHWIPYYLFCTPCLLNYDVVGKVETLFRDQLYAIKSTNLQGKIAPKWRHRSSAHQSNRSVDISKMYFSQLSSSEVQKLYEKYKLDFELFGYSASSYLKYTI